MEVYGRRSFTPYNSGAYNPNTGMLLCPMQPQHSWPMIGDEISYSQGQHQHNSFQQPFPFEPVLLAPSLEASQDLSQACQAGEILHTLCNTLCYNADDAHIIFEACLRRKLFHISRRPSQCELKELIKSGSFFVFEEKASRINWWTDRLNWSPSRIAPGSFLVYREDPQHNPGEKKEKLKRNQLSQDEDDVLALPPNWPKDTYANISNNGYTMLPDVRTLSYDQNLVGSLDESYGFRPDALIKKTMSMTIQKVTHHLICYYS